VWERDWPGKNEECPGRIPPASKMDSKFSATEIRLKEPITYCYLNLIYAC